MKCALDYKNLFEVDAYCREELAKRDPSLKTDLDSKKHKLLIWIEADLREWERGFQFGGAEGFTVLPGLYLREDFWYRVVTEGMWLPAEGLGFALGIPPAVSNIDPEVELLDPDRGRGDYDVMGKHTSDWYMKRWDIRKARLNVVQQKRLGLFPPQILPLVPLAAQPSAKR